jgi:hypothetical protein
MRTGHLAIGLAAFVGVVPASVAQASRGLDQCKSAGTGIEAEERQAQPRPGGNSGVSVAVPIGRVCFGPEAVDGEPTYVRRTKASEGMAIVEVSTTPFMPVLASGDQHLGGIGRTDQPAGW